MSARARGLVFGVCAGAVAAQGASAQISVPPPPAAGQDVPIWVELMTDSHYAITACLALAHLADPFISDIVYDGKGNADVYMSGETGHNSPSSELCHYTVLGEASMGVSENPAAHWGSPGPVFVPVASRVRWEQGSVPQPVTESPGRLAGWLVWPCERARNIALCYQSIAVPIELEDRD